MGKKRFREALLGKEEFVYTLELVPGRGSRGKTQDEIVRLAEQVARTRLATTLSVTDNPGGHPALCRRCGDCTLLEVAFLCPQSQCPKYLLNGQCGGSREGWCEVFPGKRKCIYVRAYNRLKPYSEEKSLREGYTPPRNWALDQISSWANCFLGRDHHGQK